MATSAANIPINDSTGNLNALLNLYGNAKGTSTSSTTSSNLSQDNLSALIQSILGGPQGLASVSSGQKSAGLYNSSTNQQMINDLLSRVTTETASRTAGSTTTNRTAGKVGGNELLTMLGSYAGSKLLGPTLKKFGNPLDEAGTKIAEYFNGGTSAATGASANSAGAGLADYGGGFLSSTGEAGVAGVAGTELAGGGGLAGLAAETAGEGALGGVGIGSALSADGAGTAAALAAGGTEVGGAALATEAAGAVSWEAIGTWIMSLFSDERLKMDVKEVGETKEGQSIYTYKYKDNPFTTHMGVMAQETRPEAVVRDPSGYLRVNYDKILGVD